MKKTLLFIAILFAVNLAFGQQILHEPFDYTVGESLTGQTLTTSNVWVEKNGATSGDMLIVAQPTWSDFGIPLPTGNAVGYEGGGDDLKLPFTEVNSGTIYFSFLMNVVTYKDPSSIDIYRQVVLLNSTGNAGPALFIKAGSKDNTFNVGYGSTDTTSKAVFTSTDYDFGTQFFFVISYKFDGTIGKLWVNPTVSAAEPVSDLTLETIDKTRNEFVAISMEASSNARTPNSVIDEIRIGTTWESVISDPTASVDEVFSSKFSVYPNPASEFVTISSELEVNKVEIFNLLGKRVISKTILSTGNLDISSLSKGVYLMKLTSGDSVASKKLIKN
ncbi:T9SS type A sorting domain-containing protein [uncultured Polaribacter sp.]|uniref:T9SS type A sorting domain-containing protein n=1 Tax=uncultured Polaribacter sp. TaxID=174711 RepID=UPI0026079FE9|nr:T9SS type A sorting domain-containing protein [uncultured Polaribacter sp.]